MRPTTRLALIPSRVARTSFTCLSNARPAFIGPASAPSARPAFIGLFLFCISLLACSKHTDSPDGRGNTGSGTYIAPRDTTTPHPASVSVLIDQMPMTVTGIKFGRNSGSFNFSAWNSLQRVDVYCFWFYQRSRWDFQYADSINYSVRPDTTAAWTTTRATNWGTVNFDCCSAPLSDSVVKGEYSADFIGKPGITVGGNFYLVFGGGH